MERPGFDSTIWSDGLHARGRTDAERREALDRLCRAYWAPLHAWLRRRGVPPQDAEDSVQGFLAHFIEKALVDRADPARGRFRNYLLKTFEHWLSNERRITGAAKRGGGRPPAPLSVQPPDLETPEDAFNRSWALTVLGRAQEQLKQELHAKGLGVHYAAFCACLSGSDDRPSHEEMARKLGCSPADVATLLYASRRRLGELVRSVLRDTVDTGSDVETEVSELFKFLLRKRPRLTS